MVSYEKFKSNWKRYLWSSGVTFVSSFCIVMLPQLNKINLETIGTGTVVSIFFVAFRAGVKAVVEFWLEKSGKVEETA